APGRREGEPETRRRDEREPFGNEQAPADGAFGRRSRSAARRTELESRDQQRSEQPCGLLGERAEQQRRGREQRSFPNMGHYEPKQKYRDHRLRAKRDGGCRSEERRVGKE